MITKEAFVADDNWSYDKDSNDPRVFVAWHEFQVDNKWEGFKVEVIHAYGGGDEFWMWRAFSTFASPLRAVKDAANCVDARKDAYDALVENGWFKA